MLKKPTTNDTLKNFNKMKTSIDSEDSDGEPLQRTKSIINLINRLKEVKETGVKLQSTIGEINKENDRLNIKVSRSRSP